MKAFAELSEDGERIEVHFPYSPDAVAAIKSCGAGARFVPKERGGPLWTIPLNLESARRLREAFGAGLQLGNAVRAWGREQNAKERNLGALANADSAELKRLPVAHPEMFKFVSARPYQTADIAMMSVANVLNANQPGTGKTIETIASVIEAGLDNKPVLVSAPVRSLENVWKAELERFGMTVYTAEDAKSRAGVIAEGVRRAKAGEPVWICVNPDMMRLSKVAPDADTPVVKRDHKGNAYGYRNDLQREIMETKWGAFVIDEFHKTGLNNTLTLFGLGVSLVQAERRHGLSGTPMGGKPIRLFPVLKWLEPNEYTSKWRWADQWLVIEDNGFGKKIGGLVKGREEAFEKAHARHLVRRLKREALPGLPPKVTIEVVCPMTKKQERQYKDFARDAEIRIEEERLSATNVLAEYARLKQFANATCEIIDGDVWPTADSGKWPQLLEKLDEHGIRKDEPEPGARAIVASASKRTVEVVARYLAEAGIACDTFTGETKDSRPLISRFQDGSPEPYVLVMTTQTGGVSLNLEAANSVHILDETWNPDDQEQLEDRGDRGSRTTPLMCYYYRTTGTIQEYIAEVCEGKNVTNKVILDARKKGLRA